MMRLTDAVVLAATKLRTHRVRTAVVTVVSGTLFGLLMAAVIIAQGIFESADRFNTVGLSNRNVILFNRTDENALAFYYLNDQEFIERVEVVHKEIISKKEAAAKKYGIQYDSKTEDPSPVATNDGRKTIREEMLDSRSVVDVQKEYAAKNSKGKDISDYYSKYPTVRKVGNYDKIAPESGTFDIMKNGKENFGQEEVKTMEFQPPGFIPEGSSKQLQALPQELADPFITYKDFDTSRGEIPVIIPGGDAESLLGLKKISRDSSAEDKTNRIKEIRDRVGEITVEYCYRNERSNSLLQQAIVTRDEIEKNKNNRDYQKPSLIYAVPDPTSCGPVVIGSDTRTAEEKADTEKFINYQKEIGEYEGDPEQTKITLRGVGVSASSDIDFSRIGIEQTIQSMLSAPLGYGFWNVPLDMLNELPESSRPAALLANLQKTDEQRRSDVEQSVLLEFGDVDQARALLADVMKDENMSNWAFPFGSANILVSEGKSIFNRVLFWVVIVVGAVAVIILSGLVGRTIADSRKETAVFRSIGATRGDIASIYIIYTVLFSLRVVVFAIALAIAIALVVNTLWAEGATYGAQLAYGLVNDAKFSFIGLSSVYVPILVGAIVLVGLISSTMPILRNARRNPIKDMRDE